MKRKAFMKNKFLSGFKSIALPVLMIGAASLWGCSSKDNAPQQKAAAPAVQQASPSKGNPASGKEIYFRYCHFCHGQKGMGDGPVGIAITPHPADFVHDAKRMNKTDAEIFKSITEGIHRDIGGDAMAMPRWQDILSDQERWDVLAFIRQLEREGKAEEAKGANVPAKK